jgi:hypothetical protein
VRIEIERRTDRHEGKTDDPKGPGATTWHIFYMVDGKRVHIVMGDAKPHRHVIRRLRQPHRDVLASANRLQGHLRSELARPPGHITAALGDLSALPAQAWDALFAGLFDIADEIARRSVERHYAFRKRILIAGKPLESVYPCIGGRIVGRRILA